MALSQPPSILGEHMFVLGIDPGLTRTGYGLVSVEGASPNAVATGVLHTDPGDRVESRLAELYRDLVDLIAQHQPTTMAVERVFVNKNLNTAIGVARASGVALLAGAQAGLTVTEYTPSEVKMALLGYGNAPKDQVKRVVAMRLGLDVAPSPADAADALAIALCHLQSDRIKRRLEQVR